MRFDAAGSHDVGVGKSFTLAGSAASAVGSAYSVAPAANGDIVTCGRFSGATAFDAPPVDAKGAYDGFVARISSGATTRWMQTFGGVQNDECKSLAIDPIDDQVVIGINYESSGVKVDGTAFPDPSGSGLSAAGIVKLGPDGKLLWGHGLVGSGAHIDTVALLPQGDVLYAGEFLGTLNLGGGEIQSAASGTQSTFFVARRGY